MSVSGQWSWLSESSSLRVFKADSQYLFKIVKKFPYGAKLWKSVQCESETAKVLQSFKPSETFLQLWYREEWILDEEDRFALDTDGDCDVPTKPSLIDP